MYRAPQAIINARFVTPEGILDDKALLFDRRIVGIVKRSELPQSCETIDAAGAFVAPGFVDIHIHGSGGADVMDATPEAIATIARILPSTGTTSFLATTMTMPIDAIEAALCNVKACQPHLEGARLLGVHLEGPFINPTKHGAQDRRHVRVPDIELIERYAELIKVITLAPETDGMDAFIDYLRTHYPSIVLSIGHSDATYEEAQHALGRGVRHVTHLFNAMSAYHHRAPGIVGAVFDDETATADIIADGIHTHPHHLRLAKRMLGRRLMLITDAMRAGCMRNGRYDLGGQCVHVHDGKAVLEDGTLAGSVLTMNEAARRFCLATDADVCDAVYAASTAPSQLLGYDRKGVLREGADADIVVFDRSFGIMMTIIDGNVVYRPQGV